MMDLSNVVDTPFEEIKAGDEILIKCKVDDVYENQCYRLKIIGDSRTGFSFGISKNEYVGKIEQPPKVGDRYKHEHGQPIRIIFIVRDYAILEFEAAEIEPIIYTFCDLKRLKKLPESKC